MTRTGGEDPAPPGRVGVQLGFGSPPPPPRAFKAAKGAIPPERGGDHLDFRSKDIENTNGVFMWELERGRGRAQRLYVYIGVYRTMLNA